MRKIQYFLIGLILPIALYGQISFLIIGDWGRKGKFHQREVAVQMEKVAAQYHCNFVISTGDNFYSKGVKSVHDAHWQKSFEQVYAAPSLNIPWYSVLGNHDYRGNIQAQIDYSRKSDRWYMPARYYSLTKHVDSVTTALFVFLDTNELLHPQKGQDARRQWKWLEDVLSHSSARWKFVVGHHPVYSGSPMHGDNPELIRHLRPLLEKYGVQVYFCGHDHDLQYLKPPGRVHYIVSGAGSQLRETGREQWTRFSASRNGFVLALLKADLLEIQFIDLHGQVLYRAEISP